MAVIAAEIERPYDMANGERRRTPRLSEQTIAEIADAVAQKLKQDPGIPDALIKAALREMQERVGRSAIQAIWTFVLMGAGLLALWAKGFFKGG